MAGPKKWSEQLIAQRAKDGRGHGIGDSYSPWLYVQEFSSRGTQTRIHGVKLRRTVHTFSYLERDFFLLAEFQPEFLDFQEQYAMDRRITLGAAKALGYKHPRYPGTRVPVVMTLDAVVTMKNASGESVVAAWDVKPARRLAEERVAEKLAIHRVYCARAGIPHYIFTERSYSKQVARNIDWIRMSVFKDGELAEVPGLFTWHPQQMLELLRGQKKKPVLWAFCASYDTQHQLPPGSGLRIMKQLLWDHLAVVNMKAKHIERELVAAAQRGQRALGMAA